MLSDYYLTFKMLHILAFIAWMAGLLYLPRLFIYHLQFEVGSKAYGTFCTMERRLLKIIMLPAILLTFTMGLLLAAVVDVWSTPWFHMKFFLVLCLAGFHGLLARLSKGFARGDVPPFLKKLSKMELCFLNEVPFLLAIGIVFLAVWKPF